MGELIFGIAIVTASRMKKLSICFISFLYIGIVVITVEFLFLTVLVANDIQYLLPEKKLTYSTCSLNVNILGFSTWQVIQYIVALYAIIKFQIDFNAKRRKKLSSARMRASSVASSLQFFSNRIHRLTDQDLVSAGLISVPIDNRTGINYKV